MVKDRLRYDRKLIRNHRDDVASSPLAGYTRTKHTE